VLSRPGAGYTLNVHDIVFLVLVVGFFASAVLLVRACELILGRGALLEQEREP
jgi:hypothetical protein